jgi:hypothetical protein
MFKTWYNHILNNYAVKSLIKIALSVDYYQYLATTPLLVKKNN